MFLEQANQLHDERWKSVYAWFERVMELPAGERLAFSQQAIQDWKCCAWFSICSKASSD